MARRKRVDLPSPEVLKEMEAGFEVKSAAGPRVPPIAQVAAESAALSQPLNAQARADAAAAERLRTAEAEGRLAVDIPIGQIEIDEISRDRVALDPEEMAELKVSISTHGQTI